MMRIAPSSVSRRPASARRRAFTGSVRAVLPARSKRSCTAEATLLTFCPPGPDPRTKDSDKSLSGRTIWGVTSIGILVNRWLLRTSRRALQWLEHAQLALGNRYGYAILAEESPDRPIHIRSHVVDSVHGVGDPEAHFDAHSIVFEGHEACDGRRVVEDARMIGNCIEQQLQGKLGIVVVTDHDGQANAYAL